MLILEYIDENREKTGGSPELIEFQRFYLTIPRLYCSVSLSSAGCFPGCGE